MTEHLNILLHLNNRHSLDLRTKFLIVVAGK